MIFPLQAQQCEFSVRVSFLELYNEELFDLLGSSVDPLRLKIYEDSSRKVGIPSVQTVAETYFFVQMSAGPNS